MKESRCIICGEKKDGLEVKDDYVIEVIRWLKKNITKDEKGARLVVCKEDFPKYKKARDSYKKKQMAYTILGLLFALTLVGIAGSRILLAILLGLGVIAFMYLLAQLSYMPDLIIKNMDSTGKFASGK